MGHGVELGGDVAGAGQDQGPGQLGGGVHRTARAAVGDAEGGAVGSVDHGVAGPGGHQQAQVGEALQHRAGKGRALPHGHHDLERFEGGHQLVYVGDVVVEHGDVHPPTEARPVGRGQRHPLVVVEDRHPFGRHGRTVVHDR